MATNQFGSMFIHLRSAQVASGEQIDGIVMMKISHNIEAASVTLKLQGVECIKLKRTAAKDNQAGPVETTETEAQLEICSFEEQLLSKQFLAAGQHTFPFSVLLTGEDWPTSTNHDFVEGHTTGYGRIAYTLSVLIESATSSKLQIYSTLVQVKPAQCLIEELQNEIPFTVKKCLLGDSGYSLIIHRNKKMWEVEDDHVLTLTLRNQKPKILVNTIKITLLQIDKVLKQDMPMLSEKILFTQETNEYSISPLANQQEGRRFSIYNQEEKHRIQLASLFDKNKKSISPSTSTSKLFSISHFLKFDFNFSNQGTCATKADSIVVPVIMSMKSSEFDALIWEDEQKDWNPITHPHSSCKATVCAEYIASNYVKAKPPLGKKVLPGAQKYMAN